MKSILTTILLVLATSQVNADGFYQAVVGNSPQADQQVNGEAKEFSYTPLYSQVTASAKTLASQESIGLRSEFTYTPLYLQVVGPQKPWSVTEKIAKN